MISSKCDTAILSKWPPSQSEPDSCQVLGCPHVRILGAASGSSLNRMSSVRCAGRALIVLSGWLGGSPKSRPGLGPGTPARQGWPGCANRCWPSSRSLRIDPGKLPSSAREREWPAVFLLERPIGRIICHRIQASRATTQKVNAY